MSALVDVEPRFVDAGTAEIAVRTVGSGPPVLFVHGWPLTGLTWRNLVPVIAPTHTCVVVDLPGSGATRWRPEHDFMSRGQAAALGRAVDALGLGSFAVVAHDTGATIARQLAIDVGARVTRMVLMNTEIPGHRPPWIRPYQAAALLPGAAAVFRLLMGSRAYRRSSLGFGGSFCDLALIDGDFHALFVQPLLDDPARLAGELRYLRGIDWNHVDSLATEHAKIQAHVRFVWGVEDPTFPLALARAMLPQLAHADLVEVPGGKLFVHEEKAAEVAAHALAFLAET